MGKKDIEYLQEFAKRLEMDNYIYGSVMVADFVNFKRYRNRERVIELCGFFQGLRALGYLKDQEADYIIDGILDSPFKEVS